MFDPITNYSARVILYNSRNKIYLHDKLYLFSLALSQHYQLSLNCQGFIVAEIKLIDYMPLTLSLQFTRYILIEIHFRQYP